MKLDTLTFSTEEKRTLFDGKKVSAVTDIDYSPSAFAENVRHISISGAQEKLFAVVDNSIIRLAHDNEQSTYIIKPTPANEVLMNRSEMAVNELLTMQIAAKVYGIDVAPCGLILLNDKRPAYIVRRFDVATTAEGITKLQQEDVCTLLGKTATTHGGDFKYKGSYLEIASVLKATIPAWRFELPRFFSLVLFNYLFSNGDAHLKNFSVLRRLDGTLHLSPAYDLLNTSLHIEDADFALSEGLGIKERSDAYDHYGHPSANDFRTFGLACGLTSRQVENCLKPFIKFQPLVEELCKSSLLSKKCQRMYLRSYKNRLEYLNKK